MSIDVSVDLPEHDKAGELVKSYYTLMRSFGWDLYITSHFALREKHGPNWFAARISELKDSDPKHWNPNAQYEPQDPAVILRDYVHEHDSPYLEVFGSQFEKLSAAKKILGTRNRWFHFGASPTLDQLGEIAKVMGFFVASSGMSMTPQIKKVAQRVVDLKSGRYVAPAPGSASATQPPVEPAEELETPADLPRPPIGGTWVGEIPELRYRISRTGDVIHPDTMESVRSRVAGDFDEKFRSWTAVEPRGRELWIAEDGAVGGFIGATPRLLGYLGDEPEGDVARGFFTPHFYAVEGDSIVDLDTGDRLTFPLPGGDRDGAILRVTTYGDLVVADDTDGVERVATVNPSEWFPGHL